MRRISMTTIAAELGLSKTTVSWVINGKSKEKNISKATQDRILTYAKIHNFKPNPIAKSLSIGKTNTIGLIVPNIADAFYVHIARTVEIEAEKHGYTMIYSSSEGDPKREANLLRMMTSGKVDGIILAPTKKDDTEIRSMISDEFPFVLIDRYYPDIETHYVIQDNFTGTYDMVSSMMIKGYKKVAFITTETYLIALQDRKKGYEKALEDAGIETDENIIKSIPFDQIEDQIFHCIKDLVFPVGKVDAIYFATHYLAIDGIKVLQDLDIDIPARVGVASYGDDACFTVIKPSISATILPYAAIGKAATDILTQQINNPNIAKEHVIAPTKLNIRDSF